MDSFSFPRLEAALGRLASTSRQRIVLGCSGLEYINSASLGFLIGCARRARERGGDVKLAALTPKIASVVELLGFDRILQTFPNAEAAKAAFKQS